MGKSATSLEYLQAMKNELEDLNHEAGPTAETHRGLKDLLPQEDIRTS
jgi:hypothetical protein